MTQIRKIPPYEQSLAANLLAAKEAVIAPMRPKLREHGITEPQWRVMRVINDRGATDATGIAETGHLHAPSVTRILKELEQRGLILREPDPNDRRRTLVNISPHGQKLVKTISRQVMRVMREYADRFGQERLESVAKELRALTAAIEGVD